MTDTCPICDLRWHVKIKKTDRGCGVFTNDGVESCVHEPIDGVEVEYIHVRDYP